MVRMFREPLIKENDRKDFVDGEEFSESFWSVLDKLVQTPSVDSETARHVIRCIDNLSSEEGKE
jgi:hypothetical protein